MFVPSQTPPDLTPARLRGLRFSLNAPVVATEAIPAGPARGALLVHRDARGRLGVALCVRSLRTGAVVLYRSNEGLEGDGELSVGIDAALSFGESLGFLFDDDELEKGLARPEALARWREFLGALDGGEPDAPADDPGEILVLDRVDRVRAIPVEEPHELVLDDLADADARGQAREHYFGEIELRREPPGAPADLPAPRAAARAPAPEPAPRRALPLTKFRELHGAEPAPAIADARGEARPGAARLARVRLVKRARAPEPPAAGSVLLRLLGCF
jgi:hypothetical protein